MSTDLLGVSITGLNLSQTALRTAGHNIANANTEGYTRQSVTAATNNADFNGTGYVGSGVNVQSIERNANAFVTNQLRTDTALYTQQQTFFDNATQLDNFLSNPAIGLSDSMQSMFSALHGVADNPTSIASRQLVISEADAMTARFNNLYDRFAQLNSGIDEQLQATVDEANELIKSVAGLNQKIKELSAAGGGLSPNDMLDQRDNAVLRLSELIGGKISTQDDGQVNIALGNGQPLVIGNKSNSLTLVTSGDSFGAKEVGVVMTTGVQLINANGTSGKMGGLLEFRGDILDRAYNEIGRVAVTLSQQFNDMHTQGLDLNGNFGVAPFTDINSEEAMRQRVIASSSNAPPQNASAHVEIVDTGALLPADYTMEFDDITNNFTITRSTDGAIVNSSLLLGAFPQEVEFDGLKLTLDGGQFNNGDKFLIRPLREASRTIDFSLDRPEQLALASPIMTDASLGNMGTGYIDFGEVLSLKDITGAALPTFAVPGEMDPPLLIQFTGADRFDVLDNTDPGNPVQLDPPIRNQLFVPGQDNALFNDDPAATILAANGSNLGLGLVTNVVNPINNYQPEVLTFTTITNPTINAYTQDNVNITAGMSARDIAAAIGEVSGVSATAWTDATISGFGSMTLSAPLQLTLNGEALVEYDGLAIAPQVPDPAANNGVDFRNYLVDQINDNATLAANGVSARAYTDALGNPQLMVHSSLGDDLQIAMQANPGQVLNVSDGVDATVLAGAGANYTSVAVGGQFDITMGENITVASDLTSTNSLLGDAEAQSSYRGIQAVISGYPTDGDTFTIQFNQNATTDNRNALRLLELETGRFVNGGKSSLGETYGLLVEEVGIRANAAKIGAEASKTVLDQTTDLRASISGVNLDEEAANLIKFEQMYSANAQVISVARQLFDRLMSAF